MTTPARDTSADEAPRLVDIAVDDPRLPDVYEVLCQLRTELTLEGLRRIYSEGYPQGLRFLAVEHQGRLVAVAGWRFIACTVATRRLYIDDLVTDARARSSGHGRRLIAELQSRGRAAGCTVIDLDSGVHRGYAHRFYFREGLTINSYHLSMRL